MYLKFLKNDVLDYFRRRSRFAQVTILVLCSVLFVRLAYLQIYKFDELSRLSENNRIRERRIKADRGFIKDRNNLMLVKNISGFEIEIVKEDVDNITTMLNKIENIVNIDRPKVERRISQSYLYEPAQVTRGLDFQEISYFMEHSDEYAGLQFVAAPMRSYTDAYSFTHLIGYMGEISEQEMKANEGKYFLGDTIGKSGLEKEYEDILKGSLGSQTIEVDRVGRQMDVLERREPVAGDHLILTIDYELQLFVAELVAGKRASIIVLENKDNSILSLYSGPTYDLDIFNPFITLGNWDSLLTDPYRPLLNRTIEGAYPPASTFKILMATAGLNEGIIDANTTYHCPGVFKISPNSSIEYNCWKRTGHGRMNLKDALKHSCDVYFYNLGLELGIDNIEKYSTMFGLGRTTGIHLPNEKSGTLPGKSWKKRIKNEGWYPGDTVNLSIGQGYATVTPLQLAIMTSSIFNGGYIYEPRVVGYIENAVSGERVEIEPVLRNTFEIPKKYTDQVMAGLVSAVEEWGTSWRGKVKGFRYGGKTGTAQVVSLKAIEGLKGDEIPEHLRDHSWYVAVFPEKDPKYTLVVMIEHGGSGGRASATAAGQIIGKMLELGYVQHD